MKFNKDFWLKLYVDMRYNINFWTNFWLILTIIFIIASSFFLSTESNPEALGYLIFAAGYSFIIYLGNEARAYFLKGKNKNEK